MRPRVNLPCQNSMALSQVKLLLLSVLLVNVVSTTPIYRDSEQLIKKPVPNVFEGESNAPRRVYQVGGPYDPYGGMHPWSVQQSMPPVLVKKDVEGGSGQFISDCEVLAAENRFLCTFVFS